jgi:hypothetical protein
MEIRFSMANGTFKMKMDIDRHGPRLMPNNYQHLDPPYFSLPTTFNGQMRIKMHTALTVPLVLHRKRMGKYAMKKFCCNGQRRKKFF